MTEPDARRYYDDLIALLDAGGRPTPGNFAGTCHVFRAAGYRAGQRDAANAPESPRRIGARATPTAACTCPDECNCDGSFCDNADCHGEFACVYSSRHCRPTSCASRSIRSSSDPNLGASRFAEKQRARKKAAEKRARDHRRGTNDTSTDAFGVTAAVGCRPNCHVSRWPYDRERRRQAPTALRHARLEHPDQ